MTDPIAPPDGIIDGFFTNVFGRSWRTSLGGAGAFVCGIVVVADQFIVNPVLHTASGICIALGLAAGGAGLNAAKDARVTGLASKK